MSTLTIQKVSHREIEAPGVYLIAPRVYAGGLVFAAKILNGYNA